LVASLLDNPKVDIVIDDGRRWLNRHPERKFDAIIQNTTWCYRPNVTNLLSREYLALIAAHLRQGGVIMSSCTIRPARCACSGRLALCTRECACSTPWAMSLDSDRLRQTLGDYPINGRSVLDTADPRQAQIEKIVSDLPPPPAAEPRAGQAMEDCGILDRSAGLSVITDDNMGEEWSSFVTTDPLVKSLASLARR
jgi:spermidine synthase